MYVPNNRYTVCKIYSVDHKFEVGYVDFCSAVDCILHECLTIILYAYGSLQRIA